MKIAPMRVSVKAVIVRDGAILLVEYDDEGSRSTEPPQQLHAVTGVYSITGPAY